MSDESSTEHVGCCIKTAYVAMAPALIPALAVGPVLASPVLAALLASDASDVFVGNVVFMCYISNVFAPVVAAGSGLWYAIRGKHLSKGGRSNWKDGRRFKNTFFPVLV